MALGGGRVTKDSAIDLTVGILLQKKNADEVKQGETLAVIYGNEEEKVVAASEIVQSAYEIGVQPIKRRPVIIDYIN